MGFWYLFVPQKASLRFSFPISEFRERFGYGLDMEQNNMHSNDDIFSSLMISKANRAIWMLPKSYRLEVFKYFAAYKRWHCQ